MNRFGHFRAARSAYCSLALAAALGVVALVGAAHPANAQDRIGKSTGLTAFGGYYIASDLYTNTTSGSIYYPNQRLELKNNFEWGGRLDFFTNRFTAVELGYTRVRSDLQIHGGSTVPSNYNAGSIAGNEYDLNFLISSPSQDPKFWPYFTIGFGWTGTEPSVSAVTPITGVPVNVKGAALFAWNFGLGSFININPKLSLRLDGRWRITTTGTTTSAGTYCDYYGYCWAYSSNQYSSGDLTAGLTYRFKK
jgi:opacity protein-like surface antigen